MKRISVFTVVLSIAATGIANGHSYHYYSSRRRVRWSMHAHALVPSDLRYSPYAHKYGHSGLVPYWVRYSPYAYGNKHRSGLVNDYACSTSSVYYCPDDILYRGSCWIGRNRGRAVTDSRNDNGSDTRHTRKNHVAQVKARREQLRQLAQSRKQQRLANRSHGKETIAQYLRSKNIDFRTNRQLLIEGKTLSVDFILGDGRAIITYWDPVEIQALDGQAEHRKLLYQNHVKSWKDFCAEYQRAGGKIVQIVSTDGEDILAKLTLCDELNDVQKTYAMAPMQPQP